MTNAFIRKVAVERKVLSEINAFTPGMRQLAGLSSPAIEAWRRTAQVEGTDHVVSKLLLIAGLCQQLTNRSHENFKSIDPKIVERIDCELEDLKAMSRRLAK